MPYTPSSHTAMALSATLMTPATYMMATSTRVLRFTSILGFCQKAIIRVPVSYGARVSDPAFGGLIPLHLAAYYADTADVLSYLLELSSKLMVAAASGGGMTPLHWAISRSSRISDD